MEFNIEKCQQKRFLAHIEANDWTNNLMQNEVQVKLQEQNTSKMTTSPKSITESIEYSVK